MKEFRYLCIKISLCGDYKRDNEEDTMPRPAGGGREATGGCGVEEDGAHWAMGSWCQSPATSSHQHYTTHDNNLYSGE